MTERKVSPRMKTPACRHSDYWSKKTSILIWTLLTTNLLLLILVMRLNLTCEEKHREYEAKYFADPSPQDETTEYFADPSPQDETTGLCRPCPHRWIWIEKKCYFFSENKKTKDESDKICGKMGGRLATVKEGEIKRLVAMMDQEFWVGLNASGSHYQGDSWIGMWSDGTIVYVQEGSGTCAKLAQRLTLENCYRELFWICAKVV